MTNEYSIWDDDQPRTVTDMAHQPPSNLATLCCDRPSGRNHRERCLFCIVQCTGNSDGIQLPFQKIKNQWHHKSVYSMHMCVVQFLGRESSVYLIANWGCARKGWNKNPSGTVPQQSEGMRAWQLHRDDKPHTTNSFQGATSKLLVAWALEADSWLCGLWHLGQL